MRHEYDLVDHSEDLQKLRDTFAFLDWQVSADNSDIIGSGGQIRIETTGGSYGWKSTVDVKWINETFRGEGSDPESAVRDGIEKIRRRVNGLMMLLNSLEP